MDEGNDRLRFALSEIRRLDDELFEVHTLVDLLLEPDVTRTRRLEVIDTADRVRAVIAPDRDGAALRFFAGPSDSSMLTIGASTAGPSIAAAISIDGSEKVPIELVPTRAT